MGQMFKIALTKDVPVGGATVVEIEGHRVALFNVEGNYYAIDDACTHQAGPLSEGQVEGTTVTCPWHNAMFDIATGDALCPPAPEGVSRYKVHLDGEEIKIELPEFAA